MLATVAAMVMIALSIRQCYSISQEEFEKTVETCGTAPFEDFEGQADMRRGEFPWNVLISYPEGPSIEIVCAGVLIAQNYVLASSRCLQDTKVKRALSSRTLKVHLGIWRWGEQAQAEILVSDSIVQNQYKDLKTQIDIGIAKLASNVQFSDMIQPICLPLSQHLRSHSYDGEKVISTGWGTPESGNRVSQRQKFKITVSPIHRCTKKHMDENTPYRYAIGYDTVCAGGEFAYDNCVDTDGGTLVALDASTNRWVLVGLTPMVVPNCASYRVPQVFVSIASNVQGILSNMGPPEGSRAQFQSGSRTTSPGQTQRQPRIYNNMMHTSQNVTNFYTYIAQYATHNNTLAMPNGTQ